MLGSGSDIQEVPYPAGSTVLDGKITQNISEIGAAIDSDLEETGAVGTHGCASTRGRA